MAKFLVAQKSLADSPTQGVGYQSDVSEALTYCFVTIIHSRIP
jgi:hypothetical protein